jgi:hypothetical protein
MTAILRIIIALAVALGIAKASFGHEWYTHQRNEQGQSCCGGNDCAALPAGTRVTYTGDGYDVTIVPGTHPMVMAEDTMSQSTYGGAPYVSRRGVGSEPVVFHFPGNPGLSPDGQIHACITPAALARREITCLFIGGTT